MQTVGIKFLRSTEEKTGSIRIRNQVFTEEIVIQILLIEFQKK
jgi:hypothetical protein